MKEIDNLFDNLNKRQTYGQIACQAGISRTTLLSVRKTPEKSSLQLLRKVAGAMGYDLILIFRKIEDQAINEQDT